MPNQFFFEEGTFNVANDIEESFATDYWFFEQYIGDQLWSWGQNSTGQIGDNTTGASRSTPRQEFTSSTNWKQVSAGGYHTAAIKTDGTLWTWGFNAGGQIGDNTRNGRSTPLQVGVATNWKQVSAGGYHTSAIKTDGTLWIWGLNGDGQLGVNQTLTDVLTPTTTFIGGNNWKQVSCGQQHTAAIKTDGTLWCWGDNIRGQIGDNTIIIRSTPRQVGTATNWKQVSAGGYHTAAIKTDGTLWCWGLNSYGQIGDNTQGAGGSQSRSTPRQVGTATNWKQVDCGSANTVSIKSNGTLWSWGNNNFGQIGDNTTNASRSTPRQEFTSSTNWKQVDCGTNLISAIKTDGTLWSWGLNGNGQVGDNTTVSRSTPRQEITLSTNWKQVGCGSSHVSAVKTGLDIATGLP